MPAGTKLVTVMIGLAVLLGVGSWWYRYEAAHRSTEFWGTRAAGAIARPDQVVGMELRAPLPSGAEVGHKLGPSSLTIDGKVYPVAVRKYLTEARGIKHMDSMLLADQNFLWDQPVENSPWKWAIFFVNDEGTAQVLFSEDLKTTGSLELQEMQAKALNCTPLKPALEEYFARPDVFGASKQAE